MKFALAAIAAGLALAGAAGASATTYTIQVNGTITSTTGSGPVHVGDVITLSTTFNDNYVVAWGNSGYQVAGAMISSTTPPSTGYLDTTGALNWSVSLDGYTWSVRDYAHDFGIPWYVDGTINSFSRGLSGPAIVFNNGGVFGIDELGQQATNGSRPELDSVNGSIAALLDPSRPGDFNPLLFSTTFNIRQSPYQFPGSFNETAQGAWNLAGATILVNGVSVPEPATWAMMITGFGLVGGAMRLRRRRLAPAA